MVHEAPLMDGVAMAKSKMVVNDFFHMPLLNFADEIGR